MKIKNIIPIFMALFVVACSTTGNNRNNNSGSNSGGTTSPPEEALDLGITRNDLAFYTGLLDGDVKTEQDSAPVNVTGVVITRGTTIFRSENLLTSRYSSLLGDNILTQSSLTNDMVEYIVPASLQPFYSVRTVVTRRGFALGTHPKKFWSNDVVLLAEYETTIGRSGTAILLQDQNGETIGVPTGFEHGRISLLTVSKKTAVINQADQTTGLTPDWSDLELTVRDILFRKTDSEIQIIDLNLISENTYRMADGIVHTYTRQ